MRLSIGNLFLGIPIGLSLNWKKIVLGVSELKDHSLELLSISFPMKCLPNYKKVYRYGGKINHFHKRLYMSPYADARGLKAGSQELDKRAVAVMHELLSFTIEKRLGKRFSVFLTEAYEGSELIEKCLLVLWKEKFQSLIDYRERKKKIKTYDGLLDIEDEDFFGSVFDDNSVHVEPEQEEMISDLEDDSLTGNYEIEI
ncbi:hypothetical protein F0562_025830 [Nyssa sinensis]|uniref:PORR domain-containing protein n=1 Tax=Nyssa sinensis TaxID=561372 RepID=A0A5J5B978_9ASTE|nr:hypothetical protein F0562_025830 [Nyssa sinensis]